MNDEMGKVLITVIFVLIAIGMLVLAGCSSADRKYLECVARDQTSRPCGGW